MSTALPLLPVPSVPPRQPVRRPAKLTAAPGPGLRRMADRVMGRDGTKPLPVASFSSSI
jgi:hypothetical protein